MAENPSENGQKNEFEVFKELAKSSTVLNRAEDDPNDDGLKLKFNAILAKHSDVFKNSSLTDLKHRIDQKAATLKAALIVVDFQNDFVTGSLSIRSGPAGQDAEEAIEPLNKLLAKAAQFQRVIYTMDWHPPNHISFLDHCRDADRKLGAEDARKSGFQIGQEVRFEEPKIDKLALYPAHCVQESWGAQIHSELLRVDGAKYIQKGCTTFSEAYSGFVDNQGENRTELEQLLRGEGVQALFICGLALDICVAWTARDAAKLGFLTAVLTDCSRGLSEEGIQRTGKELAQLGVAMLSSEDVLRQFVEKKRIPVEWIGPILEEK